ADRPGAEHVGVDGALPVRLRLAHGRAVRRALPRRPRAGAVPARAVDDHRRRRAGDRVGERVGRLRPVDDRERVGRVARQALVPDERAERVPGRGRPGDDRAGAARRQPRQRERVPGGAEPHAPAGRNGPVPSATATRRCATPSPFGSTTETRTSVGATASPSAFAPASRARTTAPPGGDGKAGSSGVRIRPPATPAGAAAAGAAGAVTDAPGGPGTERSSATATSTPATPAPSAASAARSRSG